MSATGIVKRGSEQECMGEREKTDKSSPGKSFSGHNNGPHQEQSDVAAHN
jgi:hypothetical protein